MKEIKRLTDEQQKNKLKLLKKELLNENNNVKNVLKNISNLLIKLKQLITYHILIIIVIKYLKLLEQT